jgi:hypothetical protein
MKKLYQYTFPSVLLQEDVVSSSKTSKAPKCKEEYMPSDEIEDFCNEILKAGTHLASVSGVSFLNAESVSDAISCVLSIVEQYNLVGRWVTSHVSKHKKEYATTKEIRHVCCFAFFFINQYNVQSLTIGFFGRLLCGLLSIVWRSRTSVSR